jgi:hypothetical protein
MRYERLMRDFEGARAFTSIWMLHFLENRNAEQIEADTRRTERAAWRSISYGCTRFRRSLAEASARARGCRSPSATGTSLRVWVPRDQWFPLRDGDAVAGESPAVRGRLADRGDRARAGNFCVCSGPATRVGVQHGRMVEAGSRRSGLKELQDRFKIQGPEAA